MKKQECVVRIPGLNERRRFLLPDNMPLTECIHLMVELIKEEYPGIGCDENRLDLFKALTGEVLEKSQSLSEIDISEYDELILG